MQSIIFTNGMIVLVKAWILEVSREIAHKMQSIHGCLQRPC